MLRFFGVVFAFCVTVPLVFSDVTCDRFLKNRLKNYKNGAYMEYNDSSQAAVTVSEAHGYGMMIAVLKNDRATFDKLLNYFKMFKTPKGFMQWQQSWQGGQLVKTGGDSSATDGDLDIAHALLLAKDKWGGAEYGTIGTDLVKKLYDNCINPTLKTVLLGDWVTSGDQKRWTSVRPGDLMLGHFAKFATVDARWNAVKDASIKYVTDLSANSPKGLFPDFAQHDGKTMKAVNGFFLEKNDDGAMSWNSCRMPWRLAAYYKTSKDPKIAAVLKKMLTNHFDKTDPVQAGYKLDGTALVGYEHNCFTASVWAGYKALGYNPTKTTKLADKIQKLPGNYYGDAVACLAQLQMQ